MSLSRAAPLVMTLGVTCTACGPPQTARAADPTAVPPIRECHLIVEEARGADVGKVAAFVAPARPRVEACRGPAGGKLRVRVDRRDDGGLKLELAPPPAVDEPVQRCVLDALRKLEGEDAPSPFASGATIRQTGFTSLVTIEWR